MASSCGGPVRIGAGRYLVVMVTILFAVGILRFAGNSTAETLYVDASNAGDPSMDGSPAHPFDAIQRGIDNASASDVVVVANGSYAEAVVISTALTLRGNGSAVVDPGPTATGVLIQETAVVIRDIDVTDAKYGIEVDEKGTTVEDCTIDDCQQGIRIQDQSTSAIVLSDLTVFGCQEGIWIAQSTFVQINDVNVSGNQFQGIYLYLADNCVIEGGKFLDNGDRGFFLESSSDNTIREVEVRGSVE